MSDGNGGQKTVQAEKVGDKIVDNIQFVEYNIGKIKNCFVQTVSDAMYNDGGLKEFTFKKKTINAETISLGVSNSISTTKSVSMTESKENVISWKIGAGTSHTSSWNVNAEVALSFGFIDVGVSAGYGESDTVSTAVEAGKTSTTTTAQTIANSVTQETNKNYQLDKTVQEELESTWNYEMRNYELGYWYVLALVADIEVHQIVGYNLENNELYTTYFVGAVRGEGLRMLSSDSSVFEITPEYQLAPVTEIDVEDISTPVCDICKGAGDTENFAGGCGAENHPYLITNALQLVNIEKNMDAHYRLVNDIDISSVTNWEPIGGAYLAKVFNGVLDGDGHKIKGLSRQTAIAEKQSRSFFGMFGCIGEEGVVKNIVFDNVNVKIPGPANNNGSMRAFYGVVAGKCMGKVSNVELNGSFVYTCCTNGESWLGGICGYAVNAEIFYCKNTMNLKSDRYTSVVGGIVGYSEGGVIAYCENTGNITAIGTSFGGVAYAASIVAAGHLTNSTKLIANTNSGISDAKPYDNWGWGCTCKTSTTDFVTMFDTKY